MIKILKYKPIDKNHLMGFVDILVEKWGMKFYGISVCQKDGKKWISFPSRNYEKDGEKVYLEYYGFEDKNMRQRFNDEVLKALENDANIKTTEPDLEIPF